MLTSVYEISALWLTSASLSHWVTGAAREDRTLGLTLTKGVLYH